MADHPLPDWIDRRTAEWCADLCDGIAARLLDRWPGATERRAGAKAAGNAIRAMLCTGAPRPLAVVLPFPFGPEHS